MLGRKQGRKVIWEGTHFLKGVIPMLIVLVFACTVKMAVANELTERTGYLFNNSLPIPIHEIYDPSSGQGLFASGVPLSPKPTENGPRIGIIDSGIMAEHPQLRTLIVAEKAFAGSDPTDKIGHGTLVALHLINPQVIYYPAIVSARVTNDSGEIKVEDVITAIDWVIAEGSKVVNLSLGFRGKATEYTDLCKTIAKHSDILFSAAAGNFGPEVEVFPAACSSENIISVSAVYEGRLAEYSGSGHVAVEPAPLLTLWRYHIDLGNRAAKANNYSLARKEYMASLVAEKNGEALFQLALLDIHEGKLAVAVGRLNAALELEPQNPILYSYLGVVGYLQGRFNDAEMLLRKALMLNVDDQMARFNLGQTLVKLGRFKEALVVFEQLRRLNPDYPRLNSAIARAMQGLT